jgi:hypothetical protein
LLTFENGGLHPNLEKGVISNDGMSALFDKA